MSGYKLSYITELVNGRLLGEDLEVKGVASLKTAGKEDISFCFQKGFSEEALKSEARAFIVTEGIELEGKSCVVVKNHSLAQAKVLALFYPEKTVISGISSRAFVSPSAFIKASVTVMDFAYIGEATVIDEDTVIYPFVYVGNNVKIGKRVKLLPHVVIMDDVEIGDEVTVYPGSVLGSDGFGYAFDGKAYVKIPQVGKVVIENKVEIGANTTIDRATMDETRIGEGTKLDNQIMIGHNVTIGKNCVFAAQVGVAGSTNIGNFVVMGGKVGVKDHVHIGDGVQVGGMSGIMNDIEKGSKIAGIPATSYMKWLKIQSIIDRLPEIKKQLDLLSKQNSKPEDR